MATSKGVEMTDLGEMGSLSQETNVVEKQFTVREIVEAIKHNGFDHLRGRWVQTFGDKIAGGCVLAQGAFNLGVLPWFGTDVNNLLGISDTRPESTILGALNAFSNVSEKWLRTHVEGFRNFSRSDLESCGTAIVCWNDLATYANFLPREYYLSTYDEVSEMVEDILAPYLDETVTLRVVDYGEWLAPVAV